MGSARRIVLPLLVLSLVAFTSIGGGAFSSTGATATPPAGGISGRVTSSTTALGVAGSVQFRNVNGSLFKGNVVAGTAPLDGSGNYTIDLPPGEYLVLTQNTEGYVNQISNNIPCSGVCDVASATPITVTTTPVTGIDFVLNPGSRISGTVTDQNTGLPIANVIVRFYDSTGTTPFTKGVTDASGNYQSEGGTITGSVRARTENALGYFNERWNNLACTEGSGCPMPSATQIDVVNPGANTGVSFALVKGGQITGTVIDANATPLANVKVFVFSTFEIHLFSDLLAIAETDALGHYATSGLPSGNFAVYTKNTLGYVDELYNDVTCLFNPYNTFFCDPAAGTAVPVTLGAITANKDFLLQLGGQVSGAFTNAQSGLPVAGSASVFTVGGTFLTFATASSGGQYLTPSLPTGTYFVRGSASGLGTQVYNGVPCGGCDPTLGTPVTVTAGATTDNINFPLAATGSISGLVTSSLGGSGVQFVTVEAVGPNGQVIASGQTNAAGNYTITGLTGGVSYLVRTTTGIYYPGTTVPSSGTPVGVVSGATTTNINFSLQSGVAGAISGMVTNVNGGAALNGVIVKAFNSSGILIAQAMANVSGVYTVSGLLDGTYYLRTSAAPPVVDEIYNDVPCENGSCVVLAGAPVSVTGGGTTNNINFALSVTQGGRILGDVKSTAGNPVPGVPVQLYSATGRLLRTAISTDVGSYKFSDLPGGLYFLKALGSTAGFIDELYGDLPCFPGDSVLVGHPVIVNDDDVSASFTLDTGGSVIGTVRDANTLAPLASTVALYSSTGALAKTATANANGFYAVVGLPPGTYFARTQNTLGYKDKVYNNIPFCDPDCQVTNGTTVGVSPGNVTSGVNFDLLAATEHLQNPGFTNGLANWSRFATPDLSYLVWYLFEGAFSYYLVPPPPGGSSSAVILQNTNVAVGNGDPILVQFDLSNTSDDRKRISVLVHDASFTDLAVCTFWLGPNTPARRYGVLTHPTTNWTGASVSLYAATTLSQGGYYQLDKVTMQTVSNVDIDQTQCIDPFLLPPPAGSPGPELVVNGNFSTGTQGWTLFGQITSQVTGGVFEFFRPSPNADPAGAILQPTGTPLATGDRLTAHFELGNSSSVRKRVSVLLHDFHWADLTVCTFWLEPGQPLSPYTMQGYTTRPWGNATIAFYAATAGNESWMRLDNVSLKQTPGAAITGTNCFEPGSVQPPAANGGGEAAATADPGAAPLSSGATVDERAFELEAAAGRPTTVATVATSLDLTGAVAGTFSFETRLGRGEPGARVEISIDGETWQTLSAVPASDDWLKLTIDLSPHAGRLIRVRFVFDPGAVGAADEKRWQIRNVTLIPSIPLRR